MSTIASNKLSRHNIQRLISDTVTIVDEFGNIQEIKNTTSSNDIQLYIELSKRQSVLGRVENVSYKEFIELMDCNKATFYNSLERLSRLEYIRAESDRKGCWTITILNNIFLNEKDYKESYMKTNINFLYEPLFKSMGYVEKRICLYLLLNKNPLDDLSLYAETLSKAVGIKIISVINKAIENIKEIFPFEEVIGKLGKMLKFVGSTRVHVREETETSNFILHNLEKYCKTNNIIYTPDEIADVALLSGQYDMRLGYKQFITIMLDNIFKKSKKYLKASYINYDIQKYLNFK